MQKFKPIHRSPLVLLIILWLTHFSFAQTPVQTHGNLKVSGNKVVNKNNQSFSLAGNSYFWSNEGWGAERFYNASVVKWLKDDWKATIVRAAMGVEDAGGYLSNPASNKQRVRAVVDAAIAEGLYVIIDWHSHHAEDNKQSAISFFQEMATLYGNQPNVIYEIYNEPLQVSWNSVIRPYAVDVINAIRQIDPDNLIIVGTPTWSQDVDVASNNPIPGINIAYTLHFYAATHKESLRQKAQTAMNNGIALMATEWGTVEASGNGNVDQASTDAWMNFLKLNGISHLNWAVNDKAEGASILKPGASSTGGWADSQLTASGLYVKNIIKNWSGSTPNSLTVSPATLSFTSSSGNSPVSVTSNVSWTVTDDQSWITVSPTSGSNNGTFTVSATANTGSTSRSGTVTVSGGGISRTIAVTQSGSSQGVVIGTGTTRIQAEAYDAMFGIQTENTTDTGGGLNVGWIDTGDWLDYNVNVTTAGTYTVRYRVASTGSSGQVQFRTGSTIKATSNVPNTGGWQSWTTITTTVSLSQGTQTIRLYASGPLFNINWFELSGTGSNNLTVSPDNLSFTSAAGSSPVSVTSNVSWTVSANQSWLSVSPASGSNNGSFTASATANTGSASRSATITVSGGGISRTITVTQSGSGGTGCSGLPVWNAATAYPNAGTQVQYNGKIYQNNWYTHNQNPEQNSGPWQAWTLIGNCGASLKIAEIPVGDFSKEEFSVFPNPSNDKINIKGMDKNHSYYIINSSGKTVSLGKGDMIDISALPAGLYLLKTQDNRTIRFIKK